MRDLVTIQCCILHSTSSTILLFRLNHDRLRDLSGLFLVICRIADQLCENVLINQLLHNSLSCFNLILLLMV